MKSLPCRGGVRAPPYGIKNPNNDKGKHRGSETSVLFACKRENEIREAFGGVGCATAFIVWRTVSRRTGLVNSSNTASSTGKCLG